ncbi:MAG TPA: ribose-5-phosphate isomerase RpiA [Thermomicrobiales bacterium]|nr:ribose-5-phosphate isomerase RpiA [Thermomicrobiales bacterium]
MTIHPRAAVGEAAAAEVRPGMVVGLGTGTTADAFLRALGRRVAGGLAMTGVATSDRTAALATELGIPLTTLDGVGRLDLGVDGADEIDPQLDAVKGRGGALLREKLVALACADYLLIAAAEKRVERLGARLPLPVEVVPFGWLHTAARLRPLGLEPRLRIGDGGEPFRSDSGNLILDCDTGPIVDPAALARSIKSIAGVVDHGLFIGLAQRVFFAEPDGAVVRLARPR